MHLVVWSVCVGGTLGFCLLFVFHSFFFHLNIIERLMMTASREEKPKGCLMWTSRIWSFLTRWKSQRKWILLSLVILRFILRVNFLTVRLAEPETGCLVPNPLQFSAEMAFAWRGIPRGQQRSWGRKVSLWNNLSAPFTSVMTSIVSCHWLV